MKTTTHNDSTQRSRKITNKPQFIDYHLTSSSAKNAEAEIERINNSENLWALIFQAAGYAVITGLFVFGITWVCLNILLFVVPIESIRNQFSGDVIKILSIITAAFFGVRQSLIEFKDKFVASLEPPLVTSREVAFYRQYRIDLREWESRQLEYWSRKSGQGFEVAFGKLLKSHGWKVVVTKMSGDGGVDIEGKDKGGVRYIIQCKWWSKPCGEPAIRDLAGVVAVMGKGAIGMVVCKSGFTPAAKKFAEAAGIKLMGIDYVMKLVASTEEAVVEM